MRDGDLVAVLERLQRDALVRDRGAPWRPANHYASNLGHPCMFYLYAARIRWEEGVQPDTHRLGLFKFGNYMEDIVKDQLRTAGLEVLETQGSAQDPELGISGRIDARIRGTQRTREALAEMQYEGTYDGEIPEELFAKGGILTEIKGLNDSDFEALRSVDDMVASRKPWIVRWPAQLLFYMHALKQEIGLFLFISKATGLWRPIVARPRPELLEECFARIRRVNAYIKIGREAPPIPYNPGLCGRCDWSHICPTAADIRGKSDAVTLSSTMFDSDLRSVDLLERQGKQYAKGRDAVKAALNQMDVWPEERMVTSVITDSYTLLLETRNNKHYWSIKTGEDNGNGKSTTGS